MSQDQGVPEGSYELDGLYKCAQETQTVQIM